VLLEFLGPYCPDLTDSLSNLISKYQISKDTRQSYDMHECLLESLEKCRLNDFGVESFSFKEEDETHGRYYAGITPFYFVKGSTHGHYPIGSTSFNYYIVTWDSLAYVAIEFFTSHDMNINLAVFQLTDPEDFDWFFSVYPGILAIVGDKKFIAEPDENCDPLSNHFIDVSKLTEDDNGDIFMDGQKVRFVFGSM
jgi:hypothetical protein